MHRTKIDDWLFEANLLILLARLAGFEPATYGLEVRCSIQLSYRRSGLIVVIRKVKVCIFWFFSDVSLLTSPPGIG